MFIFSQRRVWVFSYGSLLAAWLSSYMYSIFDMQLIGFFSQCLLVVLSSFFLVKKNSIFNVVGKKILLFMLFFTFCVLIYSLKEIRNPWFSILVFKNVLYVNASVLIGAAVADFAVNKESDYRFLIKAVTYTMFGFGAFFAYMLFIQGYEIGGDLLSTDFAETYQGVSRFFGLIALSAAMTSSVYVAVPAMLVAVYVSFAFQSFGVFAFLFACIAAFLVKRNVSKGVWVKAPILLFVLIFFLYVFYLTFLEDADFFVGFLNRLDGKLGATEGEGRLLLFVAAIEYVLHDLSSFLFGPSFYEYSCALNRCDYRHAHNIFLNLWFYFGVVSLFFSGLILHVLKLSIFQLFSREYFYCAMLFLVFFVVACFGGDLEQNRNLFLFASAVYCIEQGRRRLGSVGVKSR